MTNRSVLADLLQDWLDQNTCRPDAALPSAHFENEFIQSAWPSPLQRFEAMDGYRNPSDIETQF